MALRKTSLQIPRHDLVTVSSAEAGASVAVANLSVNRNVWGDTFIPVTAATPLDATAKGSNAIIANTSQLAAAFATNALYDTSSGASNKDSGNFFRQAVSDGAWRCRGRRVERAVAVSRRPRDHD